ncbi:hypothetical protein [Nodosilinea sp. LEGE 07298]|uniref:hypothetical protein n=1 Tax=Nodosilinea sp. LEGE 07298 TaxID=2777970 RepID=UPI00188169A3|nr:hypothetical protein [Nodosilinea sp. LEGE 07298]
MTGNADESNQASGSLAFINSFWADLSKQDKIILGAPSVLLVTVLWNLDKFPENLKSLAVITAVCVFVVAWLIVLAAQWRRSRNRNYSLARERNLIIENWNTRYEQMHELRKRVTKIQKDLESLVQEGRLEPQNQSLIDLSALIGEIDKYIATTNRRVLEIEQSEEVVNTPEENQALIDMLKSQASIETIHESVSNPSISD